MRLWSLHPKYLDSKGLVAVWREALLAQRVLQDQTIGYRQHPQLMRFRQHADPVAAIGFYLKGIYEEAARRSYSFNLGKVAVQKVVELIPVMRGQILYEREHLMRKLEKRKAFHALESLETEDHPELHPLFILVEGSLEPWESVAS